MNEEAQKQQAPRCLPDARCEDHLIDYGVLVIPFPSQPAKADETGTEQQERTRFWDYC